MNQIEDTDSTTIYLSLKRDFSYLEEDILLIENSDFIENAYKKLHTENQQNNLTDQLSNQNIAEKNNTKPIVSLDPSKIFKEDLKKTSEINHCNKNLNDVTQKNPFIFEFNVNKKNDTIESGLKTESNNLLDEPSEKVFVLQKVNLQNMINDSRKDFISKKIAENRRKFMLLEGNKSDFKDDSAKNTNNLSVNLKSNKIDESQQKSIIEESSNQNSHVIYNIVKVDKDKVNPQNYNTIVLDNTEVLNQVAEYIYEGELYLNHSDKESAEDDKESIDSNHEKYSNNDYPNTPSSESVDYNSSNKKKKNDDFNCFIDSDCSFSKNSDDSDEIEDYAYMHKKKALKNKQIETRNQDFNENSNILNRIKMYEDYKENSMKVEKGLKLSGNANKDIFLMTVDPREIEANAKSNQVIPKDKMDLE